MAKIHVDHEDAISACESVIESHKKGYKIVKERLDLAYEESNSIHRELNKFEAEEALFNAYSGETGSIRNLMHGAAYLKHKNRRLILDTQSKEFSLISSHLIKDNKNE